MTVLDQATSLRSLMRQQPRAPVLAITSGKGGVGKTNIAVNLAAHLAGTGNNVILLDADLGLANADVLCNLEVPFNLSHVVAGRRRLAEVIVRGPGGFRLIGGASGLARMADLSDCDRQQLVESLGWLETQADLVLIDTGAGIGPNVLGFTRAADHVVVVTTPEPTAITDAYAMVKVISREATGRKISLLVNQVRTAGEAQTVHERISRVARQFLGVNVLDAGWIPMDEAVPLAVRRRVPFVLACPRCPASRSIAQLAAYLQQGAAALEPAGFFQRISRWFRN